MLAFFCHPHSQLLLPHQLVAQMPSEAFSEEWAREWGRVLNDRPSYREAAASWEGSVAVVMTQDSSARSPERAVFLDLWHGHCRVARAASAADLQTAQFILSATAANWRELFAGRLAPLMGVMSGKIRLARGSMAALVPYAGAARELMAVAMSMETIFPDGW